jgi:hypothetical protein
MLAGQADILFDEMIVVDEPLRRVRKFRPLGDGGGESLLGRSEDCLVLGQSIEEPTLDLPTMRVHFVPAGHRLSVLLELGDGEQLGAEGFVRARVAWARDGITSAPYGGPQPTLSS